MWKTRRILVVLLIAALILTGVIVGPGMAFAHCDSMDGPVVKAAQLALETGNVNLVLLWVLQKYEADVRSAFNQTIAVRKLGPQAKELADRNFFETLVRLHREGEGAPYTGLKPAGRDLGPAIPAADKVLEAGNVEPLVKLLTEEMQAGLREHFREALSKKGYNKDDVAAGREFIHAYVEFIHYAERLHQAAMKSSLGHEEEEGASEPRHEK